MNRQVGLLAALALYAGAAPAMGQGAAVGSALGAPAQSRVTAPAAAASARPGDGGGAAPDPAKAAELDAAIEACDFYKALDLGASAPQVARIMKGRGVTTADFDPSTAAWVRDSGSEAGYGMAALLNNPQRSRMFFTSASFADFIPAGGAASLPTSDDVFGPPPPPPPPAPDMVELGQKVMGGMTAQQAAETYLAAHPQPEGRTVDTAQAEFTRSVRSPGLVLLFSAVSTGGPAAGVSVAHLQLPGTEAYPGLAQMRAENEPKLPPGVTPAPAAAKLRFPLPRSPNLLAAPPPNADGTPKRC